MKKLYFIYNPLSGKGSLKSKLANVIEIFTSGGYEVTVYPTQSALDAIPHTEYACSQNYDVIVCSGGDGTLNEVIQGVMNSDNKLPIGYIPTGTTNDFARSLGVPKGIENAAEWIVNGVPFACDVGAFNDKYFTYIAAFGAFTDVAYETSQAIKNKLGHAAYILEGVKRVGSLKSYKMTIEHDGGLVEGDYVFGMITNTCSIGGVITQNDVLLDDGVYEVTLIKRPGTLAEYQLILSSLLNLNQDIDNSKVSCFRTSKLIINSDIEVPWTLDGEYGGSEKDVYIYNKNRAVKLLCAPGKHTQIF